MKLESDSESRIEGDVVVDSDNDEGDNHDKPIDEQDELKYWIKVYLKHYHYQPELLSETALHISRVQIQASLSVLRIIKTLKTGVPVSIY